MESPEKSATDVAAAGTTTTTVGPQGQQQRKMKCSQGDSELNWLGINQKSQSGLPP